MVLVRTPRACSVSIEATWTRACGRRSHMRSAMMMPCAPSGIPCSVSRCEVCPMISRRWARNREKQAALIEAANDVCRADRLACAGRECDQNAALSGGNGLFDLLEHLELIGA